eukprot:1534468-Alexandrium_andersonii.AAC.1
MEAPVLEMVCRARQSTDLAFIRSAVQAAQAAALPLGQWADVIGLMDRLEKEDDYGNSAGRPAGSSSDPRPSSSGAA